MNFFRKDKEKNPILQLFLWHFSQLIHFLINFLAEKQKSYPPTFSVAFFTTYTFSNQFSRREA